MLSLSLDLAGESGTASIQSEREVLAAVHLSIGNAPLRHCARLISATTRLAEVQLGQLDYLCMISGPGSWTGLRVAAATFNTMALALAIPVIGVTMFDVFQVYLDDEDTDVLGVVQIARNQACVAPLRSRPNAEPIEPTVVPMEDLPSLLTGRSAVVAMGRTTLETLREEFVDVRIVDVGNGPSPSTVAAGIASHRLRGTPGDGRNQVKPFYVGSPVRTGGGRRTIHTPILPGGAD